MIAKLEKTFKDWIQNLRQYKTPGTPCFSIVNPVEDSEKISEEDQKSCHWGIVMPLYLVKHSRLDIANATHKLSKLLDGKKLAAM